MLDYADGSCLTIEDLKVELGSECCILRKTAAAMMDLKVEEESC